MCVRGLLREAQRGTMTVDVKYTTHATATGGRDGRAATPDGALDVKLSRPVELGGAGGSGTNPEQLFAAGYSACFLSALGSAARKLKGTVPPDTKVTATVGLGPRSEGGFGITASLAVELPGLSREAAEEMVATAHEICPYSNATRGNVDVKLSVV